MYIYIYIYIYIYKYTNMHAYTYKYISPWARRFLWIRMRIFVYVFICIVMYVCVFGCCFAPFWRTLTILIWYNSCWIEIIFFPCSEWKGSFCESSLLQPAWAHQESQASAVNQTSYKPKIYWRFLSKLIRYRNAVYGCVMWSVYV